MPTHLSGQPATANQRTGLFLLCTLLSVFALGGCGDEKSKAESEFIRGCKSGGGTTALCGCVYDALEAKYTHNELLKMSKQYGYAPPGFMDNMLKAAQECRR
ncbi:hypothetical protein GE191_05530 [Serratia fonticola]|jgi:hypothetical protein|nr:hypothetical protein [Serratia fonticola]